MSSGPTTWFSGKSAPEDQRGPNPLTILSAAFALFSPLGVVVLAACYIAFNYYRVSHKVIAGLAAAYCVPYFAGVALFSSAGHMFGTYNAPTRALFDAVTSHHTSGWFSAHWWFWFTHQVWLSIGLGLIGGAAVTTWKWIRRPAWEDNDRIPGPVHRLRRRRVVRDIAADLNGPLDGATIGVDPFGARVVQTEAEAKAHTLVAGGSGAGKTTTMLVGIRDNIRKGEPVCVVDMKGSADLPAYVAELCERYGRRFLHWTITDRRKGYTGPADGPAFYDPIGRGDPSRKKDLLIGSEKWDVEYYKSVNENYLQTAFQIADWVPNPQVDAFTDLAALLDMDKLKQRAAALFLATSKTPEGQQHAAAHGMNAKWWEMYPHVLDPYVSDILSAAADLLIKPEESERSAVRNMAARVQKMRQSTAGAWLKRDPAHGRDIDLRMAADEGWVVVFSLDSSNYKATSQQVGGLIIQDLNTLSSELRARPAPRPFHIYVDEFSAIGQDNILDLLARARDARMPTMLSTQALADLKKADPSFLEQALGIVNCFIIHRANTEADAEVFAGLTGKQVVFRKRYGVEMTSGMPGGIGTGSATGQGMIQEEEEYVVMPREFQSLEPGQLVYIAKSPKSRVVYPVTVIREDAARVAQAIATGVAPLPVPTAPAPTSSSPFTAVEDDAESFPSPWPVMAPEATEPAPALPGLSDHATAPVPVGPPGGGDFLAPTTGAPTTGTPAGGVLDPDEWGSTGAAAAPVTAPAAGPGRPVVVKKDRGPIIDPAAYLGDRPATPLTTPVPPAPVNVAVPPAPVTVPVSAPVAPVMPEAAGEEPVFGGADVEWELDAAGWDTADLGTPNPPVVPLAGTPETARTPRTPTLPGASGNPANTPTTTATPQQHVVFDQSEWNE